MKNLGALRPLPAVQNMACASAHMRLPCQWAGDHPQEANGSGGDGKGTSPPKTILLVLTLSEGLQRAEVCARAYLPETGEEHIDAQGTCGSCFHQRILAVIQAQ